MTTFGSYSKEDYTYRLQKDPDHYWVFRYPTSDDEIYIEKLMRNNPTNLEIVCAELALLYAGSNITVTETGDLFLEADSPLEYRLVMIRTLPKSLLVELSLELNKYNSEWGSKKE